MHFSVQKKTAARSINDRAEAERVTVRKSREHEHLDLDGFGALPRCYAIFLDSKVTGMFCAVIKDIGPYIAPKVLSFGSGYMIHRNPTL